jgi:heptosyltransferase-3
MSTERARGLLLDAPPRSVLVVVTRRLGDVLLATPLVRSLRAAWPAAAVDVLVFAGTEPALAGNPDVRRVLAIEERPGLGRHLAFAARLFRRYDLALSALPGDRPTLYAFLAGRKRAGLLAPARKERWKRALLDCWVPFDGRNTHRVREALALAQALGIAPRFEVVPPREASAEARVEALLGETRAPLAVLHPYPKFPYKMWARAGWLELARWLAARGFRLALTGGPDPEEKAYVAALAREMPAGTLDLAGRLTLAGVAALLARAALYVGPDTAVTHIAAALDVPTVALFGPTDPLVWGPWPARYEAAHGPWRRLGAQAAGNVRVVQGETACAPCDKEGCERHTGSTSDCLQQLPAARVIAAVEKLLAPR